MEILVFERIKSRVHLIVTLAQRDIASRYKGSSFGVLWAVLNPILMLIVYAFVFGTVLQSRWGSSADNESFVVMLFSGLLVFNFCAECIIRSATMITENPNFVKKIIFPLQILPLVIIISAAFHMILAYLILLVCVAFTSGFSGLAFLLVPFYVLLMTPYLIGFMWLCGATGVYFRDINQFIGMLITILMFVSTVFFPLSAIPEPYRWVVRLNPITDVIQWTRDSISYNILPIGSDVITFCLIGLIVSFLGYFWFSKTRSGFADVL